MLGAHTAQVGQTGFIIIIIIVIIIGTRDNYNK